MFFFLESPIFLIKPASQQVKQGEVANFQVKIDGYPSPTITWLLNGKPLTSHDSAEIKKNRITGDSTLSISNVNIQQHTGAVTCRVENMHGSAEEVARLDIRAPPVIKTQLNAEEEVLSGRDVALKVVAFGLSQPEAQWYYNDNLLETSNVTYDTQKNEYQLMIEQVTFANNDGRYRVVLKNELGESESTTCILHVLEPVILVQVAPTSAVVDLTIDQPFELCFDISGNETPKVHFYKNDKIVEFTSVEGRRYVYKVDAVKPEHDGLYKVTAKNNTSNEVAYVTVKITGKLY